MGVGQDLLNVPFPQMIFSMAQAIAKGQLALDKSSIETLKVLAKTEFDWIPEITEVLFPKPIKMTGAQGLGSNIPPVTGVGVELQEPQPVKLTLLQAGINPTFYQFTDSIIEVKMSISSQTSSENSLDVPLTCRLRQTSSLGPRPSALTSTITRRTSTPTPLRGLVCCGRN